MARRNPTIKRGAPPSDPLLGDDPFARIERAADRAAAEVLGEDRLLRHYGIFPESGRSR